MTAIQPRSGQDAATTQDGDSTRSEPERASRPCGVGGRCISLLAQKNAPLRLAFSPGEQG